MQLLSFCLLLFGLLCGAFALIGWLPFIERDMRLDAVGVAFFVVLGGVAYAAGAAIDRWVKPPAPKTWRLEPGNTRFIGAMPVIVEDDVFVGGGCGLYEGCLVRAGAVLASGVLLTGSSRVYDLPNERVLTRPADGPLEIPAGAVVVPGARAVDSDFGRAHGLSLAAPVIVKYRDARTHTATALEEALR